MNAQTPGAYGKSVMLHGAVVLLVFFFSYAASSSVKDAPKVFELVAGEGDNYAATVAPALGSVEGIKVPAMPAMAPQPVQPVAPPAPEAVASPIQAAPEAVPTPKKAKKPADLVTKLKNAELRRELTLENKYKKAQEAAAKKLAQQQAAAKRIDAEGIRNGVIGGSTENKTGGAGGKALTREEGSELEACFALLKDRIKENHEPQEGISDSLSAVVEFMVAADGSVSNVRIKTSSGNSQFDQSVIEACRRTQSIGPRPDGRSETVFMTFKEKDDEPQ
jgi:colicin import membrane protein